MVVYHEIGHGWFWAWTHAFSCELLYMLSSQWCYVYVDYIACRTFTVGYVYMMSELHGCPNRKRIMWYKAVLTLGLHI